MKRITVLVLIGLCLSVLSAKQKFRRRQQAQRTPTTRLSNLSNDDLITAAQLTDEAHFNQTLDQILLPRVPDTPNHAIVKQFIVKSMRSEGWTVDEDSFVDNTPFGKVRFTNIIATLDPAASKRLVIACHYDSKLFREFAFVGATDSAVPCAMMINLARTLKHPLATTRSNKEMTVQFIFFDGEEAFQHWTDTDSLYGSRYMAKKLFNTPHEDKHQLTRMDLFVLLDLIGARNPRFANHFDNTSPYYKAFAEIERRAHDLRLLQDHRNGIQYFSDPLSGAIEDDHKPFLKRGVPILHLIATPFPSTWHTEQDNKENLHFPTIANLNLILRAFVGSFTRADLASRRSSPHANQRVWQ